MRSRSAYRLTCFPLPQVCANMRRTASIELHRTFFLFGPDHLAALAATGGVAVLLCAVVRRAGRGLTCGVRWGLSVALLLGAAGTRHVLWSEGRLMFFDLLPLQLCNFQILLAAFALVTRRALAVELLYFWALSGTLLAMLTPDIAYGFPDWTLGAAMVEASRGGPRSGAGP